MRIGAWRPIASHSSDIIILRALSFLRPTPRPTLTRTRPSARPLCSVNCHRPFPGEIGPTRQDYFFATTEPSKLELHRKHLKYFSTLVSQISGYYPKSATSANLLAQPFQRFESVVSET
ncbi:hypothetical protein DBV15_12134 [Temnothorax longispinosus]|uniref:Uncharacterized protein n=1 Tax=Temnothorax longispinosus TaxID=300112 RepID=A0A4S2KTE1_9HYME|nr:hypothetical protein DBV15_12134 [Temnothorax longispinosus]